MVATGPAIGLALGLGPVAGLVAVGSLVGLLGRHRPWDQLAVTITARADLEPAVTVVAAGEQAPAAGADLAVGTAAGRLGGDITVIDGRNLVIEGLVRVQPASR